MRSTCIYPLWSGQWLGCDEYRASRFRLTIGTLAFTPDRDRNHAPFRSFAPNQAGLIRYTTRYVAYIQCAFTAPFSGTISARIAWIGRLIDYPSFVGIILDVAVSPFHSPHLHTLACPYLCPYLHYSLGLPSLTTATPP